MVKFYFLWEAHSVLPILFVLTLAFDRAVRPYFRRFIHQHKSRMKKMCSLKMWKMSFFPWKWKKCALFSLSRCCPFFLKYGLVVLFGDVTLSAVVLLTKKRYSSFTKKVFVFRKTCFKVKALKIFKFSSDCHIKYAGHFKNL